MQMYGSDVILRCVHLATKAVKSHAAFFFWSQPQTVQFGSCDLEKCRGASVFGLVPIPC